MAFDPTTDSRPVVWCEARLEPSPVNGTPISPITDQKGNATFAQATSSKRPTLTLSGGKWYYSFDSVDDILRAGDLSALFTSGSATLVIRFSVTTAEFTCLYQTLSGGDDFTWLSGDSYLSIFRNNRPVFSPGITESAGLHTLMVVSSGSVYEVFVDNVSIGTQTANFAAGTDHNLGAYFVSGVASRFFGGNVGLLMLLNGVPANSTDRTEIYNYSLGPNIPPVVNAGADQVLPAGSTTASLSGTCSDSDGSVASSAYSFVSSTTGVTPSFTTGGTLTAPTAAVSAMVPPGTYTFRLTATDNLGVTTTDDVSIRINALPVVNAGADQTLALGATTCSLSGTCSDSDGSISSSAYSFVSGPAGITPSVTNGGTLTARTAGVSAMTAPGNYTFELTATDNDGETTIDTVVIKIPALIGNLAGVLVSVTGDVTTSGLTDAAGLVSFNIQKHLNVSLALSKTSYTFTPPSFSYTNLSANQSEEAEGNL
jgi:hypothetical protein